MYARKKYYQILFRKPRCEKLIKKVIFMFLDMNFHAPCIILLSIITANYYSTRYYYILRGIKIGSPLMATK